MKNGATCRAMITACLLIAGCQRGAVDNSASDPQPIKPVAERSADPEMRNVSFPMPGRDGGPRLPELPAVNENGEPQLPPLPELPGQPGAPQLPPVPELPGVPAAEGNITLPAIPEPPSLPQPPSGLERPGKLPSGNDDPQATTGPLNVPAATDS